ncbi:hypothetical protein [Sphingomonas sp. ID0503]|uniref:hypothetical protein n=1 Tax=Sphingomonas sp. ID0503 TaxID=3399691 RepID=UPI003AFB1EB5
MATPKVAEPLATPDGRYLIVRGRLWRKSNPALSPDERRTLVDELMAARRAVRTARQSGEDAALRQARERVQTAKVGLGERGPVWWSDGAPDENRRMVVNSSYAPWFVILADE